MVSQQKSGISYPAFEKVVSTYLSQWILVWWLSIGTISGAIAQAQNESVDQPHHCFLPAEKFMVGGGGIYSLSLEAPGLHSRVYYNFTERFCAGPEVSLFRLPGLGLGLEANFVAHYLVETPWAALYPIIGGHYVLEPTEHHGHEDAFGGIFGGGVHRNFFKRMTIYTEYAATTGALADHSLSVGLLWHLQ